MAICDHIATRCFLGIVHECNFHVQTKNGFQLLWFYIYVTRPAKTGYICIYAQFLQAWSNIHNVDLSDPQNVHTPKCMHIHTSHSYVNMNIITYVCASNIHVYTYT